MKNLMGPPAPGPVVRIIGIGIDIYIRVDDDIDEEVVREALKLANKRRYGKFH